MSQVRNILTGRNIMRQRAMYNQQFDFHFARTAEHFTYTYMNADGELRSSSMPHSVALQYNVDWMCGAHESAMFEVEGIKYSMNHFSPVQTERLPSQMSTLRIDESGNIIVSPIGLYVGRWSGRTYSFVNNSGSRVQFDSTREIVRTIVANIPNIVQNEGTFYESMEARTTFGPAPELRGYHGPDRSTRILRDSSVDWFVGIEVEKEDLAVRNRCAYANCDLGNGWIAESDGSLDRQTGVEVVSPVMNLQDTKAVFAELERLDWVMNAGYSRKCGGHITISRKGMSSDELVDKLMPFVPMLFSLYEGRLSNGYSGIQDKSEIKWGSRRAIHKKGGGAVEIRIFSAVSTLASIKFRIKLVQWIVSAIDSGKFNTFADVADAMFEDKKLFKLLSTQYDNVRIRRKQALAYMFGGCLENESPSMFINQAEHERMLERIRNAYSSMSNMTRSSVLGKFSSNIVQKALGNVPSA